MVRTDAWPTVPQPNRPMRTGRSEEPWMADTLGKVTPEDIGVCLPTRDDPRGAARCEHHRRPWLTIVVGRHRDPVGTGRRQADHVADDELGQPCLGHEDVTALAVFAHDAV